MVCFFFFSLNFLDDVIKSPTLDHRPEEAASEDSVQNCLGDKLGLISTHLK